MVATSPTVDVNVKRFVEVSIEVETSTNADGVQVLVLVLGWNINMPYVLTRWSLDAVGVASHSENRFSQKIDGTLPI
jgi:hypothetical protein